MDDWLNKTQVGFKLSGRQRAVFEKIAVKFGTTVMEPPKYTGTTDNRKPEDYFDDDIPF